MQISLISPIKSDIRKLVRHPFFVNYQITPENITFQKFPEGFPGLLKIIIGQQISFKVADALWIRACNLADGEENITAEWVLNQKAETLKSIGLSTQKQKYAQSLSETTISGAFDFNEIKDLPDSYVIEKITGLYGFGIWSAQIYCMLCLTRRNILPQNDLAVNKMLISLYEMKEEMSRKKLLEATKEFEGKYTALTLLLWYLYVTQKNWC